jgi:hypothetical protein
MSKQLARHGTWGQGSRIAATAPLNYEFAMYTIDQRGTDHYLAAIVALAEVKGTDARVGSDSRIGARQQSTRVAVTSAL